LGAAIAEALAMLGWKVAIGARRLEQLDDAAAVVSAVTAPRGAYIATIELQPEGPTETALSPGE
jgi:NADP-dependent 3-hydroxy acid dehydrogenase YdfG